MNLKFACIHSQVVNKNTCWITTRKGIGFKANVITTRKLCNTQCLEVSSVLRHTGRLCEICSHKEGDHWCCLFRMNKCKKAFKEPLKINSSD